MLATARWARVGSVTDCMHTDPELILEAARSIRDGLWRTAWHARNTAETLDEDKPKS